ncbi:MAG: hypothetical protein WEA58_14385 [Balneolaceae bacterium]
MQQNSYTLQIFICLLFISFFVSCNSESIDSEKLDYNSLPLLELTTELEITDSDDFIPANLNGFFVTNDGSLIITQRSEPSIHQFTPEGDYIEKVARDGQGPGELTNWFQPSFDGTTLVASNNPGTAKTLFEQNADGIFEYTRTINVRSPGSYSGIRENGETFTFYTSENLSMQRLEAPDEFTQTTIHIVEENEGTISVTDSVQTLQTHSPFIEMLDGGGIRIQVLPFRFSDSFVPMPNQQMLIARPDSQMIQILNPDFKIEHEVRFNVLEREVTDEDFAFHIGDQSSEDQQKMRELFRENKPVFMDVIPDDSNRFWLWTDDTEAGNEYVAVDYEGEPLGRILLPVGQELQMVKGNNLYVLNEPEDDAPSAIVYELNI